MDKILAINPGNTSTKIGLFEETTILSQKVIRHDKKDLEVFSNIMDQLEFRSDSIVDFLSDNNVNAGSMPKCAAKEETIKLTRRDNVGFKFNISVTGRYIITIKVIQIVKAIINAQEKE